MADLTRPDLDWTAQGLRPARTRQASMERPETHSRADVVRLVAGRLPWFTADDVWAVLDAALYRDLRPTEPRSMGALLLEAKGLGLIVPTGRYRASRRAACKGRPVMVWRSRVYKANRAAA